LLLQKVVSDSEWASGIMISFKKSLQLAGTTKKEQQNHDSSIPLCKLAVGDQVYAKNYTTSSPE